MIYFYIPVLDEQETVGVLLYRLREVMQTLRYEYTVLLTLDGCSDETPKVVAPYLQLMPIRVIDRQKRFGYGRSLWEAIRRVTRESANPKRDFFLILDADFTHDPTLLNEMSEKIERNVDLYCGNRFAAEQSAGSLRKRLANLIVPPLLRFRGVSLKTRVDLFTTLRGCRIQLLRRKLKQLQMLESYGPGIPPPVVSMLLLLMLARDARKYSEVKFSEKIVRSRTSRFRIFPLLRFALFGEFPDSAEGPREYQATHRRRHTPRRRRVSNKRRPDSSK